MKIILVINNIRSTYNVGAMLRTAEGCGVERVMLAGWTPWMKKPGILPHIAEKLAKEIGKTALGAEKMVKVEWTEEPEKELWRLKKAGWKLVGLENNLERECLSLHELRQKSDLEKIVLVIGEEVEGMPKKLQEMMDFIVEIPMRGKKESFNVSVATGMALFKLMLDED